MQRLYYVFVGILLITAISITARTRSKPVISQAPGLAASFTALGLGAPVAEAAALPSTAPVASAAPSAPVTGTSGMSILGAPTVSPALIDAVLAKYHSPAAGKGQAIHDLGAQYGIDPAFLLAFFIHESSAGTNPRWAGIKPDGTTTHNIGNIVCTQGWRCHGRFRDYPSWEAGIEDWYKLITELYVGTWNRTTVEAIIPKYAPASDNNNEAAYINQVRTMVERWRGN
jgi:hypothetical protein